MTERTETLTCGTCGVKYTHTFTSRGGRAPENCPAHRRGGQPVRDVEGARERKNATRRQRREAEAEVDDTDPDVDLRLAIGLRMYPSQSLAVVARKMGIKAKGAELEALAAQARVDHAEMIGGARAPVSRIVEGTLLVYCLNARASAGLVSPRDQAAGAHQMARIYEMLNPDDLPQEYSSIEINVRGADGRTIALGAKKGAA